MGIFQIANCRLPIANCKNDQVKSAIGNWQSAMNLTVSERSNHRARGSALSLSNLALQA